MLPYIPTEVKGKINIVFDFLNYLLKCGMRDFLEELQRRKDARENPCDSCDGTGQYIDRVCVDCLGQGVLLTRVEYDTLLAIANADDDAILDQQLFE
jgi:hypothetical protein